MSDRLDVLATLKQLIRLPSVNPMGRDVAGAPYFEYQVTDFLERFFDELGVPWHRQPTTPQRDNIVACLEGNSDAVLAFEVHQDTVPVDGMTIDPWEPTLREGRIYGRGACDDKGPMACMLTAFAQLAQQRPAGMPTIVMACTVNEENGFTGASALAQLWAQGKDPVVPRTPDTMIVAEPTSLNVVVAHKGVVRWRIRTGGQAAHSSCPELGENAIYHMGHVIGACQQYAQSLALEPHHPLLGPATLNLGTIQGGICVNAVPDQCTVELDRRLLPQEDPYRAREAAMDWLERHVPAETAKRIEHEAPFLISHGLSDQDTDQWARSVQQRVSDAGIASERIGVAYATDAPFFAQLGIAAVVFGPGSINQAHTADEWISVDQLHKAVDVYYRLAAEAGSTT